MNFINLPKELPRNVSHKTFYSKLYNQEIGYNVYLPPDYEESSERYPVAYHFHGWTGNESSEIWPMEKIYKSKRAITVFPNSSPVIEEFENLPVESMIINELIPFIDAEYRTKAAREYRSASGFSMGGGMAFYCSVKHPELFSSVTAYAGTYHHYYHKGSQTVGAAPELPSNMAGSIFLQCSTRMGIRFAYAESERSDEYHIQLGDEKQQCEIHGLPYCDTSFNRELVLNTILSDILKAEQSTP